MTYLLPIFKSKPSLNQVIVNGIYTGAVIMFAIPFLSELQKSIKDECDCPDYNLRT